MAVMAVLIQPMIKSTIIIVAAVAARLTVLCRDCFSVATRGTETCAVPTVREDGIELVIFTKPGPRYACQLIGSSTHETLTKGNEISSPG